MIFSACSSNGAPTPGPTVIRANPEGAPRPFRLGFSVIPPERSPGAYTTAFATAAQYGDIVLLQRTPPWEDFLSGAQVSKATSDNTRFEVALLDQYSHLKRFFAIDPTDGVVQRSRITNIPAGVDPQAGFNDPALRAAFKEYVAYVSTNYRPDYLAIGVEINMLAERNPVQFQAFASLYREAYEVAKKNNPKGKVFPTFQLEDLEGTFEISHSPHWELLDTFRGAMDALAISTYPFLGDVRTADEVRPDYISQLKTHFDGEIIIAETGYASMPVEGKANVGTEEDQRAYLERLLAAAEANRLGAVIWTAALDPSFAAPALRSIGLRQADGSNKLAWTTWETWSRRPLE
ncbi:MAG: hypothetical protein IPG47_15915 [Thermoflexaceae bacterium]|nr:hypothetical protein [Thermoflexaceae bacterium]